ncbi:MAG: hypothetical protein ACRDNM_04270, partial [Gaiellaceae bacterium]
IAFADTLGTNFQTVKHAIVAALEIALALDDVAKADELFAFTDSIAPHQRTPFVETHVQRLRARTAGDADGLAAAAERFRELEMPFYRAVALLELAELSGDDAPRAEARQCFERLGARPWIERAAVGRATEIVA